MEAQASLVAERESQSVLAVGEILDVENRFDEKGDETVWVGLGTVAEFMVANRVRDVAIVCSVQVATLASP